MKTYHVTGVDVYGRRFRRMTFSTLSHASMINLYRGSVWEVTNGKRKLLWRVYN